MSAPDLTPLKPDESAPTQTVAIKVITPAAEPIDWPKSKEEKDEKGRRKKFKLALPPPRVWEYRMADGSLYGAVARWDTDKGKVVLPCVYADVDGEQRWAWSGFGNELGSRPLLGLMELANRPLATVLLVEGEKTRDAAARYMPDSWVCVTWQGGGQAVKYTDWGPLAGRRVVIWPDKDPTPIDEKTGQVRIDPRTGKAKLPPGEATTRDLILLLSEAGAGVGQIPVYGPNMGMLPSNGWDLADELPAGFNPTDWMERCAAQIALPQARIEAARSETKPKLVVDNTDGSASEPPDGDGGLGVNQDDYRCIGYSQSTNVPIFHIFSARSGFIVSMTAKELCNRTGIYNVVPTEQYWRAHLDMPRDRVEKLPWAKIGEMLMNKCYDAGYFDINNERGRGAWLDDGRTVMHLGQALVVDKKLVNPAKMVSKFYYPVRGPMFEVKGVPAMTDEEGRLLRKIFRSLKWKNPFSAELLGGWVASAPVCGAMPWRTHFWLTGPSSSGKTFVVDNIVAPLFGDIALKPLGNSSAAGIMGSLRRDARPVIFDEAEGRGPDGAKRREMIIELMRYSSSQSEGEVIKGTSSHTTVSFRVQSQYFLASIGVNLTEMADMTRTVVGELRTRRAVEPTDGIMKKMLRDLPKNMPERLLWRQLRQLPTIRENAETFAQVISLEMGSRRIGDQLGTLMAGDVSLVSDRKLTFPEVENIVRERLSEQKLDDYRFIQQQSEDTDLMQHLVAATVRVQTRYGVHLDRTIGELLARSMGRADDDKIDQQDADDILRRLGMVYERVSEVDGYWLARSKTYIANSVMGTSAYPQGWDRVLLQHRECKDSGTNHKSFGGYKQRAVWIPYSIITGERSAQNDEGDDADTTAEV